MLFKLRVRELRSGFQMESGFPHIELRVQLHRAGYRLALLIVVVSPSRLRAPKFRHYIQIHGDLKGPETANLGENRSLSRQHVVENVCVDMHCPG